jgi:hypothetical protein
VFLVWLLVLILLVYPKRFLRVTPRFRVSVVDAGSWVAALLRCGNLRSDLVVAPRLRVFAVKEIYFFTSSI